MRNITEFTDKELVDHMINAKNDMNRDEINKHDYNSAAAELFVAVEEMKRRGILSDTQEQEVDDQEFDMER